VGIHVAILTHCRREEFLYGSTLVFDTLRVGFPSARVTVVDNGSLVAVRSVLAEAARAVGAEYVQVDTAGLHHLFLERMLSLTFQLIETGYRAIKIDVIIAVFCVQIDLRDPDCKGNQSRQKCEDKTANQNM